MLAAPSVVQFSAIPPAREEEEKTHPTPGPKEQTMQFRLCSDLHAGMETKIPIKSQIKARPFIFPVMENSIWHPKWNLGLFTLVQTGKKESPRINRSEN